MVKRALVGLLVALLAAPFAVFAQAPKAGVVTVLEGNVTARRVALPDPLPLKFKDDVLFRDVVTTGDKSLARMLLGGKAVVTVRERSVLTITDIPGRPTTIDLDSGKFALAVARERMAPGDEIQIRTPNAVAGVRGTVVITEVERQGAQATGGVPAVVTNFYVLRGNITAQPLDAGRNPLGTALQIGPMQTYSGAGLAPPRVQPLPPAQIGQVTAGLHTTQKRGGDAGKEQVKTQQQQAAVTLLAALSGETRFATTPPPLPIQSLQLPSAVIVPGFPGSLTNSIAVAAACASESCNFASLLLDPNPFASFDADLTSTSLSPLFQFTNQSFTKSSSFFKVTKNGKVTLAGPLANFVDTSVLTGGSLLDITGSLKSTGSSALLALDPSVIRARNVMTLDGGSLTLAGPLLTDKNGVIVSLQEFMKLINGASLTSTGSGALVQLDGTSTFAGAALNMTSSTMTLAGPLVMVTNGGDVDPSTIIATFQALGVTSQTIAPTFLLDKSTLTSTGTGALIQIANTDFKNKDGNFMRLVNGSTLTLAGPLLSASLSDFVTGNPALNTFSFLTLLDGSQVKSTSSQPFLSFSASSVDSSDDIISIRRSISGTPSRLTLAGPLFSATNSTFDTTSLGFGASFSTSPGACCNTFNILQGAQVSSTGSSAFIQLTGSSVIGNDAQSGGSFLRVADTFTGAPASELVSPASLSLGGPLLSAANSTVTALFDLVQVQRSSLSSTSTSPLVSLSGGSVTLGGTNPIDSSNAFGSVLRIVSSSTSGTPASTASVGLAGPLLNMSGGLLTKTANILQVLNGATFTSTTTSPLISITNGASLIGNTPSGFSGAFLNVQGFGGPSGTAPATATFGGPLLNVTGGTLNTPRDLFLGAINGGTVIANDPTQAFVSLSSGAHTVGSVPFTQLFRITGLTTAPDTDSLITTLGSITVGTNQPLQRSGSGALLSLSNGATLNTNEGLFLDTALLSATAPVLDISCVSPCTGNATTLTTVGDGINLNQNAKLASIGPLLRVNGGTLTFNGSAIRVAGGSGLAVTGDLFSISGGGLLKIPNGAALFVTGGSIVNITGALVNFGTGGGALNITNNLCVGNTCTTFTSSNFASFTVATPSSPTNITITSSTQIVKGTGSLTCSGSCAAIFVDAASKLKISGLP